MDIPLYLGLAFVLLVLGQVAVTTAGALRRLWREEALFQLKRQKLQQELASAAKKAQPGSSTWEGWRTFHISRLVRETTETVSVYFAPEDGRPLAPFLPGQYVTLSLRIPGEARPIIRCYSLSHAPGEGYYRCTIKEIPPPADRPELPFGKASRHINRRLAEGDLIDLKSPHGNFTLDLSQQSPVVLIGAGIGITPLYSMLQALARNGSNRKVLAFLQFRSSEHHPLRQELAALAQDHKNLELVTLYSSPASSDAAGRDYDLRGRLSLDVLKKYLRGDSHEYFICGPSSFMESMVAGLEAAGASPASIHFEAFGPASVKRVKAGCDSVARPACTADISNGASWRDALQPPEVRFDISGVSAPWSTKVESLLDLAEAHQVPVESGCRAGNCGTCVMPIKSGKVKYSQPPGSPPAVGSCLPCICVPDGPLVLQA